MIFAYIKNYKFFETQAMEKMRAAFELPYFLLNLKLIKANGALAMVNPQILRAIVFGVILYFEHLSKSFLNFGTDLGVLIISDYVLSKSLFAKN